MTDDLLTVLVLTYNQSHLVGRTLEGIFAQRTRRPFRLLVHDDASTDGTRAVLEAARRDAPPHVRVDLLLREENRHSRGHCVIAEALLEVTSRYVAFCEGDDWWTHPDKLQRQLDFLEANPWCAVSHHACAIVDDGGDPAYEASLRAHLDVEWRTQPRVPAQRLAVDNFVMTCTAMVRRGALRDEVLRAAHEVWPADLMLFALAGEAGDVGWLPEEMAAYRLHGANSWANATSADRARSAAALRWFLAAHLRGPMQHAAQDVLLQMLAAAPDAATTYTVFGALAEQVSGLARTGSALAGRLAEAAGRERALEDELALRTRERDLLFRELTRTTTAASPA